FRPQKQARTDRTRYLTRLNMKKKNDESPSFSNLHGCRCCSAKEKSPQLVASSCGPLRISVS
ncbi:hypothetical protein HN51_054609, partial [Arachis hypogaea]